MNFDFIETKLDLLCKGVKINSDLLEEFAWKILARKEISYSKRTGLSGVQLLVGTNCIANTSFNEKFTASSPYTIEKKNDEFIITKNGVICQHIKTLLPPKWYFEKTSDGTLMSNVLTIGGNKTLIMSCNTRCYYYKSGNQCLFCSFEHNMKKQKYGKIKIKNVIETLQNAMNDNPDLNLHLTGGNTQTPDKGLLNYLEYIKGIREVSDIPISVELAPPDANNYLDKLAEVGCNSVIINCEIWDDYKRKEICPGKSQISKKRYFESWKYALDLFGENQVASVLIAGIEPRESTMNGAKELIKNGIIPIIMPFRPIDGCVLENHSTIPPSDILYISKYVAHLMKKNGLNPKLQPGCTSCGACSVETDCIN
jgi:radical SAM protein (TIGR04043 family)